MRGYLYSIVLAGIFAAVAELVLPMRFHQTGRLLRALCALLTVFFLIKPVFLLLSDVPGVVKASAPEQSGEGSEVYEEVVFEYALQNLQENIRLHAKDSLGQIPAFELFVREDINAVSARIYCDESENVPTAFQSLLEEEYGVMSEIVRSEMEDE